MGCLVAISQKYYEMAGLLHLREWEIPPASEVGRYEPKNLKRAAI
jgi:hypothetical protein